MSGTGVAVLVCGDRAALKTTISRLVLQELERHFIPIELDRDIHPSTDNPEIRDKYYHGLLKHAQANCANKSATQKIVILPGHWAPIMMRPFFEEYKKPNLEFEIVVIVFHSDPDSIYERMVLRNEKRDVDVIGNRKKFDEDYARRREIEQRAIPTIAPHFRIAYVETSGINFETPESLLKKKAFEMMSFILAKQHSPILFSNNFLPKMSLPRSVSTQSMPELSTRSMTPVEYERRALFAPSFKEALAPVKLMRPTAFRMINGGAAISSSSAHDHIPMEILDISGTESSTLRNKSGKKRTISESGIVDTKAASMSLVVSEEDPLINNHRTRTDSTSPRSSSSPRCSKESELASKQKHATKGRPRGPSITG